MFIIPFFQLFIFIFNYIDNKYCINTITKTRYINPLVLYNNKPIRISEISIRANNLINEYLKLPKGGYYTYFDFDFTPYEKEKVLIK